MLGVRSNCRLRHMQWVDVTQYVVDVVPALPQLQVRHGAVCWGTYEAVTRRSDHRQEVIELLPHKLSWVLEGQCSAMPKVKKSGHMM